MAKTKSGGTSRLGRDSQPKYLGIKLFAGQPVKPGQIILKQRGTKFLAGKNAKVASDFSIYALKEGKVSFATKKKISFNRSKTLVKVVNVE